MGIGTDNNSITQQEQEKVAMSWEGDAVFGQVYVQQLLQRQRVGNAAAAVQGMSALRDIVQVCVLFFFFCILCIVCVCVLCMCVLTV